VPTFYVGYWGELSGEDSGEGAPQLSRESGSIVSSPTGSRAEPRVQVNFLSFCSFQLAPGEISKQLFVRLYKDYEITVKFV